MKETWKKIKCFENYEISNKGNIRSYSKKMNGKLMQPQISKKGYYIILLYSQGKPHPKKIHRLVAEAFIPNPQNKPQVNHIDGNKANNCVDNLEWCTNSENQIHAYRVGLEKPKFQRKVIQYDMKGNYIKRFDYIRNAQ